LTREELIEWLRKRIAELEEELMKMREILSVLENRQVTVQSGGPFTEEDLAALPWRGYQSGRGEWVEEASGFLQTRLRRRWSRGSKGRGRSSWEVTSTPSGRAAWESGSSLGGPLRRREGVHKRRHRIRGPSFTPEDLGKVTRRK
jgi:hypothetical protein